MTLWVTIELKMMGYCEACAAMQGILKKGFFSMISDAF